MPDCPSLQRANESRRRAWRELQRLRRILEAAGVEIAPPAHPRAFDVEGAAVAAALSRVLLDHADRLNKLQRAFIDFCQTVESPLARPRYQAAKALMEELLRIKRLSAALVEEMKGLRGSRPAHPLSFAETLEKT